MPSAYTPGLIVRRALKVRRERRLPIKGKVLVKVGDVVGPADVIARAEQPGEVVPVRIAAQLGLDPRAAGSRLLCSVGKDVNAGDVLARTTAFWGLFTSTVVAPVSGTVEYWSDVTGNLGVRLPPNPIEVSAFVGGTVSRVLENEGALIETTAAVVQGVLGVGGESWGDVCFVDHWGTALFDEATHGPVDLNGRILVYPGPVTGEMLRDAVASRVAGLIGSSVADEDLTAFVGSEIGSAVTGEEDVPFPLVVTEGLGAMKMSEATADVLRSVHGRPGALSGRTQIRAGAVRPELLVPVDVAMDEQAEPEFTLAAGGRVRLLRPPYFGLTGVVAEVPSSPEPIDTGAVVPVVKIRLEDRVVTVPRANVELLV
ncbi:MAG: hypothetical protein JW909_08770 [Planctomycetes bacterium]|nr:hypothetical protein [Planctomycetota bacterium]